MPHRFPQSATALFATVVVDTVAFRLTAEPLPTTAGWDWAAWRSGGGRRSAQHGHAPSATAAMVAAMAAIADSVSQLGEAAATAGTVRRGATRVLTELPSGYAHA